MKHKSALNFAAGAAIGTLGGGLIGLGGAEFRLPVLIGLFGFVALQAVILNKTMSLVVVAAALVFRTRAIPLDVALSHWPTVLNLLAGSCHVKQVWLFNECRLDSASPILPAWRRCPRRSLACLCRACLCHKPAQVFGQQRQVEDSWR